MQMIRVKLQDDVFVPLEPVSLAAGDEAFVVVNRKISKIGDESVAYYRDKARRYFTENFPDLKVNENLLELVGILRGRAGRLNKNEYYEYLGDKYK